MSVKRVHNSQSGCTALALQGSQIWGDLEWTILDEFEQCSQWFMAPGKKVLPTSPMRISTEKVPRASHVDGLRSLLCIMSATLLCAGL